MFKIALERTMSAGSLPYQVGHGNFTLKFSNGYTVSLAMGDGMYSEGNFQEGFNTIEVGVWDDKGDWYCPWNDDDDVIGYQTVEEVLEIINEVAEL